VQPRNGHRIQAGDDRGVLDQARRSRHHSNSYTYSAA
jgi:hypothetical protein